MVQACRSGFHRGFMGVTVNLFTRRLPMNSLAAQFASGICLALKRWSRQYQVFLILTIWQQ